MAKSKADTVLDEVKEEKKVDGGREKSNEAPKYVVDVDNTYEQVLKLDKEGFELVFSLEGFLELSDDEVNGLSRVNFKNYYVAHSQKKQKETVASREPDYTFKGFEPLGGNARRRMQQALRPRKGWHGCLKAPEERDEALASGYTEIRKLSSAQQKEVDSGKKTAEDFVGIEAGSPVRIGQEDKPELLAFEIPEERWKEHLAHVGWMSKGRWGSNEEDYAERVRRLGLIPTKDGHVMK